MDQSEDQPPLNAFLERIPAANRHRLDDKLENTRSRVRIARSLRNWKTLARLLPGIKNDIDGIENDNPKLDDQKIALLEKWVERNGFLATYRKLAECLYEAGAIESLQVLCKELGGDFLQRIAVNLPQSLTQPAKIAGAKDKVYDRDEPPSAFSPPVYGTLFGTLHYGGCCIVLLVVAALVAVGVQFEALALFRHEGGGPSAATPPPPELESSFSNQNSANPTVTPVKAEKWLTVEPTVKLMSLIQYTDSKVQERTFRLINEVQNECTDLGTQLGIDEATLKALKRGHDSPSEVCKEVLLTWINRGGDHVTWAGLLQALDAIQMGGIGKRLRKALTMFYAT